METPQGARSRGSASASRKGKLRVRVTKLGEDALSFAKWFRTSRFDLMAAFYGELEEDPSLRDRASLEDRFRRALAHGKRVMLARGVVTVLLALGALATAGAALGRILWVPSLLANDVQATLWILDRSAAVAGAATLVLVGLRLAFDRYLDMVTTSATFLAMQLASCRGLEPAGRRA